MDQGRPDEVPAQHLGRDAVPQAVLGRGTSWSGLVSGSNWFSLVRINIFDRIKSVLMRFLLNIFNVMLLLRLSWGMV